MTTLQFMNQSFLSGGVLLALALAAFAYWLYWSEVRTLSLPLRWVLPGLRALAIALAMVMLLEPTLHWRHFDGEPGRVDVLLDSTLSMSWEGDTESNVAGVSRHERARQALVGGETPLLEKLAQRHEVTVSRFAGDDVGPLWQSRASAVPPPLPAVDAWRPAEWRGPTRLGAALAAVSGTLPAEAADKEPEQDSARLQAAERRAPIVLLTDGLHNAGRSPLEWAATLKQSGRPVFAVGFGETTEPTDGAVVAVDHPPRVMRHDTVRGQVRIKDVLTAGEPLRVSISHAGKTIWEELLTSEGSGLRSIPFAFAVDRLVPVEGTSAAEDTSATDRVARLVTPLPMTATVNGAPSDRRPENNTHDFRLYVAARAQRVLLLDGRGRWETRYLRNALERDSNWELHAFVLEPGRAPQHFGLTAEPPEFPAERDAWLRYDLIITGELAAETLSREQRQWLKDFVEVAGGGWIVVDGARGHWRHSALDDLTALWPVTPLPLGAGESGKWSVRLTESGQRHAALQLSSLGEAANRELWEQLPALRFAAPSTPRPGAEVLAELHAHGGPRPLLAMRRAGAGQVLYCGADETWRWRYGVADRDHQRYWNQICRWAMRMPFAVQGEYLSLDASVAGRTQAVEVRAHLRDENGVPSNAEALTAVVEQDGNVVTRVVLSPDGGMPGLFRGLVNDVPAGQYFVRIEAIGIAAEALAPEAEFTIAAEDDSEGRELACQADLLTQLALETGGSYLPESRVAELNSLLQAYSQGQLQETDVLLWQSPWWFAGLILILAAEWWLRKQAGLI